MTETRGCPECHYDQSGSGQKPDSRPEHLALLLSDGVGSFRSVGFFGPLRCSEVHPAEEPQGKADHRTQHRRCLKKTTHPGRITIVFILNQGRWGGDSGRVLSLLSRM